MSGKKENSKRSKDVKKRRIYHEKANHPETGPQFLAIRSKRNAEVRHLREKLIPRKASSSSKKSLDKASNASLSQALAKKTSELASVKKKATAAVAAGKQSLGQASEQLSTKEQELLSVNKELVKSKT